MFFYQRIHGKAIFYLPVAHAKKIVRSSSDGVEGTSGVICFVCYKGCTVKNWTTFKGIISMKI